MMLQLRFWETLLDVMSCRTVAAILIFLMVNVGFDCWRPLRNLAFDQRIFLDQSSFENKSAELARLSRAPDVLILGSSHAMAAIATADCAFMHKPFPSVNAADFACYTEASFLQSLVGLPLTYFNYACPGFKVSQDLNLLMEVLLKGTPKLVVVMLAPRDFIDDVEFEHDDQVSFDQIIERRLASALRLYRVRGDLAYLLAKLGQGILVHPESPLTDLVSKRTIDARLPEFELDGEETSYIRRYASLTPAKYLRQTECLRRMLAVCRGRRIPVLLVNMPLPAANLELLDKTVYGQYLVMLRQAASGANAQFMDLQPDAYPDDYFRDYSHLRHPGGLQCCRAVAMAIARILKPDGT